MVCGKRSFLLFFFFFTLLSSTVKMFLDIMCIFFGYPVVVLACWSQVPTHVVVIVPDPPSASKYRHLCPDDGSRVR